MPATKHAAMFPPLTLHYIYKSAEIIICVHFFVLKGNKKEIQIEKRSKPTQNSFCPFHFFLSICASLNISLPDLITLLKLSLEQSGVGYYSISPFIAHLAEAFHIANAASHFRQVQSDIYSGVYRETDGLHSGTRQWHCGSAFAMHSVQRRGKFTDT